MAGERIDIEVADKISAGIAKKLEKIALSAAKADKSIANLKAEMNLEATVNKAAAAENAFAASLKKLSTETSKAAIQNAKLRQENNKLGASYLKTEAALNAGIVAENKAAASTKQLSVAVDKAVISKKKLIQENNRTAESQARVAIAQANARKAALALAAAEERRAKTVSSVMAKTKELEVNVKGLTTSFKAHKNSSLQLVAAHNKLYKSQIDLRREQQKLNVMVEKGKSSAYELAVAENKVALASNKVTAAGRKVTDVIRKEEMAKRGLTAQTRKLTAAQNASSVAGSKLGGVAASLMRTFGAYIGIREISRVVIGSADAFVQLQNKLKLVTKTQEDLNITTGKVFEIANKTRSSVQATTQAFIRFDMAMSQLGASQGESLRLTETINKQLILSGAASSEQASALLQLSQAFNKGKLDGDEFRSVMELMPPVADAIAKELGVVRGELLNLAPEGVITAQVMRDALAGVAEDVDKAFAKTTPTIGQSFEVLKNKSVAFFGEAERGNKIVGALSGTILAMANNVEKLSGATDEASDAFGGVFEELGPVKKELGEVLDIVKPLYAWIAKLWIKLSTSPLRLIAIQFRKVAEVVNDVVKIFSSLWNGLKAVGTMIKVVWTNFQNWFSGMESRFPFLRKISDFFRELAGQIRWAVNGLKDFASAAANIIPTTTGAAAEGAGALSGRAGRYAADQSRGTFGSNQADSHIKNAAARVAQSIASKIKSALENMPSVNAVFKSGAKKSGGGGSRSSKSGSSPLGFEGTTMGGHMDNVLDIIDGIDELTASTEALNSITQKKIRFSRQDEMVLRELRDIYQDTVGEQEQLTAKTVALNHALEMGYVNAETYKNRMLDLRLELAELRLEMGNGEFADVLMNALGRVTEGFTNAATSISNAFGDMFNKLADGFADSIGRAIVYGDDLGKSLKNVAKQALAGLISAVIKMGIQFVIMSVMQQAAMKATAVASAKTAGVVANAWAPAASMVSLGSYGANAIPATAGIIATSGVAKGLANTAGFEDGGYTGNMGRSDVAGLVHGREFVMDAESTSRIGVNNLQALQRGDAAVAGDSAQGESAGGGVGGGGGIDVYNILDSSVFADYLDSSSGREQLVNVINSERDSVRASIL